MGSAGKRQFVLIAVSAALFIAVVANVVARFLVQEALDWFPSLVTAVVVGAFAALLVFRPRSPAQAGEASGFTIESRRLEEREE